MTTTDAINTQLSNIELEKSFINALLTYPERLPLVDLSPDDIYDGRVRAIFEAVREMKYRNEAINTETVYNHLIGCGDLERAGGYDFLTSIGVLFSSSYPDDYAPALAELSTRRAAVRAAQEFVRSAIDRSKPINDTINDFGARIPKLVKITGGAQHVGVFASRLYDRIYEETRNPEEAEKRKLKTGFLDFDGATGGLRPGELLIIYGKPGLGKTKFVHQMGAQLAKNGYPGAIYQMETSEDEIMEREVSREAKINSDHLEGGSMEEAEYPLFTHAIEVLSSDDYPLYMDFSSGWNTVTLRADLTRLKAEKGVQWFVLDYLRFLTDKYGKDETERENFISSQLKHICRELELTGIVIHSMNKSGMASDSPELEHGSGGAGISFDCDKALFMVEHIPDSGNPADRNPNIRTLVFKKSRRKLKFSFFNLWAQKDYPLFVDMTAGKNER